MPFTDFSTMESEVDMSSEDNLSHDYSEMESDAPPEIDSTIPLQDFYWLGKMYLRFAVAQHILTRPIPAESLVDRDVGTW